MSNTTETTFGSFPDNEYFIVREGGKVLPPHLKPEQIKPFTIVSIQSRTSDQVEDVMIVSVPQIEEGVDSYIKGVNRFGTRRSFDYSNIIDVTRESTFDVDGVIDVFPIECLPVESSSPTVLLKQLNNKDTPCILIERSCGVHGDDAEWRLVDLVSPGRNYVVPTEVAVALHDHAQELNLEFLPVTVKGGKASDYALVSLRSPYAGEALNLTQRDLADLLKSREGRYIILDYGTNGTRIVTPHLGGDFEWPIEREEAEELLRDSEFIQSDVLMEGEPKRIIAHHTNRAFQNAVQFVPIRIESRAPKAPRPLIADRVEDPKETKGAFKKSPAKKKPAVRKVPVKVKKQAKKKGY